MRKLAISIGSVILMVGSALAYCLDMSTNAVRNVSQPYSWEARHVLVFGDSITDPIHVGCTTNYWGFLAERFHWRTEVFGVCGYRWSHLPKLVERANKEVDPASIDAVFVFLGTNDFNSEIPLGRWYDETVEVVDRNGEMTKLLRRVPSFDPNTYRGCINAGLKLVRTTYPDAPVILLTPLHRGFAAFGKKNVQPDETYSRRLGLFLDDYVRDVCEAGNIWSCPVIDLYSESGILPNEREFDKYLAKPDGSDRLHPSTLGHARIAALIAAKLNALPCRLTR